MAVHLSADVERDIELAMERGGFKSPDDVVRTALAALNANTRQFWQRIEELDAEAGEDDEAGYHPVTDEFIARLRGDGHPARG